MNTFLHYSSTSALLGLSRSNDYSACNSSMDAIARFRKVNGVTATMTHWGQVLGTGMASGVSSGQSGGSKKDQFGKETLMKEEVSTQLLKNIKKGACLCDMCDGVAYDLPQHPIARLHWEQLSTQRPRSKKFQQPSQASIFEAKKVWEEERFEEGSKKYAYHYKYCCTQCGSQWEVLHDYSTNESTGAAVEAFRTYRNVAGVEGYKIPGM